MKKLVTVSMAAAMALSMFGCSSKEDSNATKTITIGISPDYPPYESLTTDNEIVGFDVDMVEHFEKYLNDKGDGEVYKLEFKQMDFDNIITQIQGNQVDIGISGFTYSSDRAVEWSNPYLGTLQVAVVPEGSDIKTLDDLKGKSLVAQTGATGFDAASEVEDAKVTGLKNAQDIMNALAANQYDAAIIDLGVAKNYVDNGAFTMLDGSLLDEKNYIIAKEGNTETIELINECIDEFLASSEYQKLCDSYGLAPLAE